MAAGGDSPADVESRCMVSQAGPRVVLLDCGALTIKVMKPSTITPEQFAQLLPPDQGWTRRSFTYAGKDLPGAILREGATSGRIGIAMATTDAAEPLFLTCFVDAETPEGLGSCEKELGSIMTDGLPAGAAFAGTSFAFAGRTIQVPAGCQVVEGENRVRCAEAELLWRVPNLECNLNKEELRAQFRVLLDRAGKVTYRTQACTVVGSDLTCDRYLVEPPGGAPLTVIVQAGGCAEPMAQCNLPGSKPSRFPPPCDQVFSGSP